MIEGYSDENLVIESNEVKSTSDYVLTHCEGAVSWKSSQHTCSSRPAMKSKFISLDKVGEDVE